MDRKALAIGAGLLASLGTGGWIVCSVLCQSAPVTVRSVSGHSVAVDSFAADGGRPVAPIGATSSRVVAAIAYLEPTADDSSDAQSIDQPETSAKIKVERTPASRVQREPDAVAAGAESGVKSQITFVPGSTQKSNPADSASRGTNNSPKPELRFAGSGNGAASRPAAAPSTTTSKLPSTAAAEPTGKIQVRTAPSAVPAASAPNPTTIVKAPALLPAPRPESRLEAPPESRLESRLTTRPTEDSIASTPAAPEPAPAIAAPSATPELTPTPSEESLAESVVPVAPTPAEPKLPAAPVMPPEADREMTRGLASRLMPGRVVPRTESITVPRTEGLIAPRVESAISEPEIASRDVSPEPQPRVQVAQEAPSGPPSAELFEPVFEPSEPKSLARLVPRDPSGIDGQRLPPPPMETTSPEAAVARRTPNLSRLPVAEGNPFSAETQAVARQANDRVQHGFQLAQRGAMYSSRAEFTAALKMIAQAHDARTGTRDFSKAVTAGFLAIKESNDFMRQSAGTGFADVAPIVALHKTPVLKDVDVSDLTPMVAAGRYYTYAQEQFGLASSHEMVASMALFGLGKISMTSTTAGVRQMEATGQAMTLFQAALLAQPNNFRAANELGVLLADVGHLENARELFAMSASIAPHATTYKNLAQVNQRLGANDLAASARNHAVALEKANPATTAGPSVQWVDAGTFARTTSATDNQNPAIGPPLKPAPASQPATNGATKPQGTVARKGLGDLFSPRR